MIKNTYLFPGKSLFYLQNERKHLKRENDLHIVLEIEENLYLQDKDNV